MTEARFDVTAIGSAIVDILSRTNDEFLKANGMVKGTMALTDAAQEGLDRAFLVLLLLTGASGLLLLTLRHNAAMGTLLLAHLGVVLALFVTLPYGKFVHGIYRAMALAKHAREERLR